MDKESQETHRSDRRQSRKLLGRLLLGFCALSLLAELHIVLGKLRSGHFGIDGWFGFYVVLAFAGCAILILLARVLGFVLRRPESYYGDVEGKTLPEDIDESA